MAARLSLKTAVFSLATMAAIAGAAAQSAPAAPKVDKNPSSGLPPVKFEEIVPKAAPETYNLPAIAAGAMVGVVAVNLLAPAVAASAMGAAAAQAPLTAAGLEGALATSRLYAVAGALGGGIVGHLLSSPR